MSFVGIVMDEAGEEVGRQVDGATRELFNLRRGDWIGRGKCAGSDKIHGVLSGTAHPLDNIGLTLSSAPRCWILWLLEPAVQHNDSTSQGELNSVRIGVPVPHLSYEIVKGGDNYRIGLLVVKGEESVGIALVAPRVIEGELDQVFVIHSVGAFALSVVARRVGG